MPSYVKGFLLRPIKRNRCFKGEIAHRCQGAGIGEARCGIIQASGETDSEGGRRVGKSSRNIDHMTLKCFGT